MGMSEQERGLYDKYKVIKIETNEEITDVFVLRPLKDLAARVAILAYARATKNSILARSLEEWMQEYDELACIDPARHRCEDVKSPVCCCHCQKRAQFFDEGGLMCYLSLSGEVLSVEECKYWSEVG